MSGRGQSRWVAHLDGTAALRPQTCAGGRLGGKTSWMRRVPRPGGIELSTGATLAAPRRRREAASTRLTVPRRTSGRRGYDAPHDKGETGTSTTAGLMAAGALADGHQGGAAGGARRGG